MDDSLFELSKKHWNNPSTGNPNLDQVNTGSLQRIALATEKMASNYQRMENDLAMYKRWLQEEKACSQRLYKSNAALRGHLKRLKNK